MVRIQLSPLTIAPASGLRRRAPRPLDLRQAGYDDAFDWFTVFYDCFRATDPRWIGLLGPPLAELTPAVLSGLRPMMPSAGQPFVLRELDRHAQIWIPATDKVVQLNKGPFEQGELIAQPNGCDLFRGKRAIFTKSKDNDLIWIRDWAYFHVRTHGANAVLLYDNASRRYSSDEIREMLARVPGVEVSVVVDWPYKFGPQGFEGVWDSDFCEYGIMEHARHRFLALAEGVINTDIDEVVVTNDGSSVFDRALASHAGIIRYKGIWIESASSEAPANGRRHIHFLHRMRENLVPSLDKWTLAPMRCPSAKQWLTHSVDGLVNDTELAAGVLYRHFRAINTNWKESRWAPEAISANHMPDDELGEAAKIFQETPAMPNPILPSGPPSLSRKTEVN
jgi:hypothetical protein